MSNKKIRFDSVEEYIEWLQILVERRLVWHTFDVDMKGNTFLHVHARRGFLEIITSFINRGYNLTTTKRGRALSIMHGHSGQQIKRLELKNGKSE